MDTFHGDPALARRLPLLTRQGHRNLMRLTQHPAGPRWNHEAGDRLKADDLTALGRTRRALVEERLPFGAELPIATAAWIRRLAPLVPLFRTRIPDVARLEAVFPTLPTTSREDIALRPESLVPDNADLDALIAYRTAGTTGHALLVAHHPRAAASYPLLIDYALERWKVRLDVGPDQVACFLVGAQRHTVTYPTVLSVWRQAGFAKLNLHADDWPSAEAPQAYFDDLKPQLLTGDPLSFAALLQRKIQVRPRALITTAVAMTDGLRDALTSHFGSPVIDWYSLTETGPIGYACPLGGSYHVLPHDLFVEVLDPEGRSTQGRGEITVTGGRNPYIPLLRYRTGDFGRLDTAPCACGDPMPRLVGLEGRAPVPLRSSSGDFVNTVDVSRTLRELPLVQHELVQHKDLSLTLTLRTLEGLRVTEDAVLARLRPLFGELPLRVVFDAALGDRKVIPYASEVPLWE